MIELPLILVAGVFGSAHCIGMCGPIALAIGGGARDWRINLGRQLAYTFGRVATYAVLGAMVGYAGWRLAALFPSLVWAPAFLSLAAGLVLVYQGALSAGWIRRGAGKPASPCLAALVFAPLFRAQRLSGAFLSGVATAFLPCGLLYGMLAMSAGTADMLRGAAIMATFALGTAPVMVAAGCGASLLRGLTRARLIYLASWCVMLAGVVCIARGAAVIGGGEVAAAAWMRHGANASQSATDEAGPWCR